MAHQSSTGSSTQRRGPQLVNLPADILRTILDLLDVDVYWGPDRRTLRALSLTSKALTAHAQRLLFRSPFFTLDLYRHITRIIVDENNRVVGLEGSLGPTEEEPLTKFTRALKRNPALGLYVRSFKLSIRPPRTHDYDEVDPGRKHRRPDSPDSEDSDDSDDLPVKNDDDHHHRVRRPWHQKLVEKEFYSFLPLFTRLQHLHIVVQRHHLDNLDPPPYSVARVLELLSSSDRLESLHLESTRLDLPFSPTASLPPNTIPALSRLKRLVLDNCEWDSPRSPSPSSERSSPPAPTGTDMSTASGGSCQPEQPPLHLEHLTIYGPRTSSLQPIAALQAPNTLREFHLCTNRNMSMDYKSLYRFDRTGSSTTESTSPSSSSEVVPLRVLLKKSSKSLEKFMFSYPPGWGYGYPTLQTSLFASTSTSLFTSLTTLTTFTFRINSSDLFDWRRYPSPTFSSSEDLSSEESSPPEHPCSSSNSNSISNSSSPPAPSTSSNSNHRRRRRRRRPLPNHETLHSKFAFSLLTSPTSALSSAPNLTLLQIDLFGNQTLDDFQSHSPHWQVVSRHLMDECDYANCQCHSPGMGSRFKSLQTILIRVSISEMGMRSSEESLTKWMRDGPFSGLKEKRGINVQVQNVNDWMYRSSYPHYDE